jgi:glycosyltransferase involved in cell wall biosynthesis
MVNPGTLVSIGLPVRNAGSRVADVVRSVLSQDHKNLELVISDNASTDDTEHVCSQLAKSDSRIAYHRQSQNIGLVNNFRYVMNVAAGTYFRWIGDDDRLDQSFVTRCLEVFDADPRLILVTTGISYIGPDGTAESAHYTGTALTSDDPVDRLVEMLRLLNESHLLIDPVYGMLRREAVAAIPRPNMVREDEVFATKLALAGPWGHIPDVLAQRVWKPEPIGVIAQRLGVPAWQSRVSNTLACREMLKWLPHANLTTEQRRRARAAVYTMYVTRQWRVINRRTRKVARMVRSR